MVLVGRAASALLIVAGVAGCAVQPATPTAATGSSATSLSSSAPDSTLYAAKMKACLEADGYAVEVTDDGGIGVEYAPPGTNQADVQRLKKQYDRAYKSCLTATGFDVVPSIDPVDEYRQQVAVDDCLRSKGIPVQSPTLEEFERGEASNRLSVLPKDPAQYAELQAACHF